MMLGLGLSLWNAALRGGGGANPVSELAALLSGQSAIHFLDGAADVSGTLTSTDLSGLSNDFTQATAGNKPTISTAGAAFDVDDFLSLTVSGGTFTLVMSMTHDGVATSGNLISDDLGAERMRYVSGGAAGLGETATVDGVATSTRGQLYTAINGAGEVLLVVTGADYTGRTAFTLGKSSLSAQSTFRRAVLIDEGSVTGADYTAAVTKASALVMA